MSLCGCQWDLRVLSAEPGSGWNGHHLSLVLWLYGSDWNDTTSLPRSPAGQGQILGLLHNSAAQCSIIKIQSVAPFVWRTRMNTIVDATKSGGRAWSEIWPHIYFIFL